MVPRDAIAHTSDHVPVLVSLPLATLGLDPPVACWPSAESPVGDNDDFGRLQRPIKPTQLAAFTAAAAADCGLACDALRASIAAAMLAGTPGPTAADVLAPIDAAVTDLLASVMAVARRTCDTYKPPGSPGGAPLSAAARSFRRSYLSRSEACLRLAALHDASACRKALAQARQRPGAWPTAPRVLRLAVLGPGLAPTPAERAHAYPPPGWVRRVTAHLSARHAAATAVVKAHVAAAAARRSKALARDLASNMKRAVATVLAVEETPSLRVIRARDGTYLSRPADVLAEAAAQYAAKASPVPDAPGAHPMLAPPWSPAWQAEHGRESLDPFQLRTAHASCGPLGPSSDLGALLDEE